MLVKFLPRDKCLIDRFFANHISRVDRSESRPENIFSMSGKKNPVFHRTLKSIEGSGSLLSEISRLEMFGISAMHPSSIWDPPERNCWNKSTQSGTNNAQVGHEKTKPLDMTQQFLKRDSQMLNQLHCKIVAQKCF